MTEFPHRQSAHCESGVVANMLTARGLEMSEPMAFGLSASLIFAYLPMIKMAGLPLIAYRMTPGSIMRGVSKAIGAEWSSQTFSDADSGMAAMDEALAAGRPVGIQTGIYWLPYIPEDMRFHFNAHNLVVSHKQGEDYVVSDPLFDDTNVCDAASLKKARFAKGVMAPKGRMYHVEQLPDSIDYHTIIPKMVRRNAKLMKAPFVPMVGMSGIRYMGGVIKKTERNKPDQLKPLLGHIVRMQEEIGTGGAGFRFIYAAFLKEAAHLISDERLADASKQLVDAGDEWRRFALNATKMCRDRKPMNVNELDRLLNVVADKEQAVWTKLRQI